MTSQDRGRKNLIRDTENPKYEDAFGEQVSLGTTQTSMPNPGGYQVAYGSLTSSGSAGSGSARVSSRAREQKRAVPNGDVAVVMARSGSTGTINGDIQLEEDW